MYRSNKYEFTEEHQQQIKNAIADRECKIIFTYYETEEYKAKQEKERAKAIALKKQQAEEKAEVERRERA